MFQNISFKKKNQKVNFKFLLVKISMESNNSHHTLERHISELSTLDCAYDSINAFLFFYSFSLQIVNIDYLLFSC